MRKYVNFLNLIEVVLFLLVFMILIFVEDNSIFSLYFTIIYWITVFIINFCYYTYDLVHNKHTPQISVYSPTAIFAYILSVCGQYFVNIKNGSYLEFIKSANDGQKMSKKQRISAYLYYWVLWLVCGFILLFIWMISTLKRQIYFYCLHF